MKDATPDELMDAVRSIAQGGAPLEAGVAAKLLESMSEQKQGDELSARELDVLRLLAAGASNKAIANQLSVSKNTVKTPRSHVFDKLGVQSRTEAMTVALQRGLLELKHSE